jgi:NAD(P)-dependent dehydrogenase (short-subunit alcohol dehydrogenase family)
METLRIGPFGLDETPFLEITEEQWAGLVRRLESAVVELGQFARDCEGSGSVVVVSAASAARAIEGCTLDAVAGAFLTTVAQVAAVELAPRGVTANVVVPARPPDPAAVEAVAGFLCSDAGRGVTGAVIAADGGFGVTKEPGGKPPPPGTD